MSSTSLLPSADAYTEIRDSLAQITAGHEEASRFLSEMLAQVEDLWGELIHRQKAWQSECRLAEEEIRQREASLERRFASLEAERNAMEAERKAVGIGSATHEASGGEGPSAVQLILDEMRKEREAVREAIAEAKIDLSRLDQTSEEIAEIRTEIRLQGERLAQQAEQRTEASTTQPPTLDAETAERLLQAEHERTVLETELEAVRNRAAELSDSFLSQSRQAAEERAQWGEELKRMRQVLEALTVRVGEHPPAEPSEPAGPVARTKKEKAPEKGAGDPVLDSVMAQFEMLQKDLAKRRKTGSTT